MEVGGGGGVVVKEEEDEWEKAVAEARVEGIDCCSTEAYGS